MITYRADIWNELIEFLKILKDYKLLEVVLDGKIKNRITNIYNDAIKKMRISDGNLKLLGDSFRYLNERNISSEDIEYMNECEVMGRECTSSLVGQEIFEEAKANLIRRKQIEELDREMMEADIKLRKAEDEHFKFVDAQDKTVKEYEDAKIAIDKLKKLKEEINNSKGLTLEEEKIDE